MLNLSLKAQIFACLFAIIKITTAAVTSQGCYVDDSSLTSLGAYSYQSEGYCAGQCTAQGSAVFAMANGDECACGNTLPSSSVASTNCNTSCVGYPPNTCGGTGFYSVWLTGVGSLAASNGANAANSNSASHSTTAAAAAAAASPTTKTTSVAPSVVYITTAIVQQGVTVVQTVMGSTTSASTHASSSSRSSQTGTTSSQSKAQSGGGGVSGGAIAGIVIGVIAALAIGALAIFFYRRRRRDDEDIAGEYKRHIEPPTTGLIGSHPASLDNRLDTSMAIRRNSSESLADNQDYSRKILRVVN